jgi:uncharacterized membrane protein YhaH (DUF805 family)
MALALVRLLFSFRGRIPRKQYWLAQSLLWVASLAGAWIIDGSAVLSSRTISPWLIGWNFILLFPELAVVVKRFNDRGRPIWLAAFWLGMTLSGLVAMSFGLFADSGQLGHGFCSPYLPSLVCGCLSTLDCCAVSAARTGMAPIPSALPAMQLRGRCGVRSATISAMASLAF